MIIFYHSNICLSVIFIPYAQSNLFAKRHFLLRKSIMIDGFQKLFTETLRSVSFLSRIHVPDSIFSEQTDGLRQSVGTYALAGFIITLPAAATIIIGTHLFSNIWLTASIALLIQICVTGALHEDGLADTVDALGGHHTKERALAIMKDSRTGVYGVIALVFSIFIRLICLITLIDSFSPFMVAYIYLSIGALSRAAMTIHWAALPPAKLTGVAASQGRPCSHNAFFAFASAAAIALPAFLLIAKIPLLIATLATLLLFIYLYNKFIDTKINGHTGDTIGTAQQMAEVLLLIILSSTLF